MKLTKPQIEKINQSIKPDINYQDIRAELVDHLASTVEQEMNESKMSFEIALDIQLSKINLDKVQRQIMLNHHFSSFKKLFKGWLMPENFGLALLVFCLTFFLVYIGSIEASITYSSWLILLIIAFSASFTHGLFTHGLFKIQMLRHSEFMSNINCLFFLYVCMSFSFDIILEYVPIPKQIFMPLFLGILIAQLIIGIKLASNTYYKLKLAP